MKLTDEQQAPLDYVKKARNGEFVLVDSVAGSGKTSLLIPMAKSTKKSVLYLAYSKAVAVEAQPKFGSYAECSTTHSFAYKNTVNQYGLKVGSFSAKDVKLKGSYDEKYHLVECLRDFCLSTYLSYEDYAKEHKLNNVDAVDKHLNMMYEGTIECTHDFYLKLAHILLADGDLDHIKYDIVMLDEGGDLNPVTLEIVKLINARVKVVVGDPHQNIFSFNNTINCFKVVEGTSFKLSKSFRVSTPIANDVEAFCRRYLDSAMTFTGVDRDCSEITSRAYITRTNSALIGIIIDCCKNRTPYSLIRKPAEIFKTSLMLCSLKYQGKIYAREYSHLQSATDDWFENKDGVKQVYKTLLSYINYLYGKTDPNIQQGINLIFRFGKKAIFDAYNDAKNQKHDNSGLVLLTAHSSKGLEFDEVIIGNDLNDYIANVKEDFPEAFKAGEKADLSMLPEDAQELFRLYYVACTRALKKLSNAVSLYT